MALALNIGDPVKLLSFLGDHVKFVLVDFSTDSSLSLMPSAGFSDPDPASSGFPDKDERRMVLPAAAVLGECLPYLERLASRYARDFSAAMRRPVPDPVAAALGLIAASCDVIDKVSRDGLRRRLDFLAGAVKEYFLELPAGADHTAVKLCAAAATHRWREAILHPSCPPVAEIDVAVMVDYLEQITGDESSRPDLRGGETRGGGESAGLTAKAVHLFDYLSF